jgi:DNA repair exonuclease SbcCD nuclease subunit
MKIALITDQHFGARNDSSLFLDFYEKFYNEVFFPKLEESGIDTVLILGDTFDRRKYINFHSLKRTKEMFFDKLSEKNIKVYMLAGNHDTYFKNTNDVNSIDLVLREYQNVVVLDKPANIQLKSGTPICMIPWICAENYDECMDVIKKSKADVCCGHFEIAGFAMHRGMPSEEGLNRSIFRKFDYTFSGHYHHRSDADGIYYLGNPYELTWQDYNDTRGFHLFDPESKELEFVPNPFTMFVRLVYDDKAETILDIASKELSSYTGKYIKVVVVNKTNPYAFDQFMNRLYDVGPADITIVEDSLDLPDGDDDDKIDEAEDTITIINKYVDALENDGIDNSKLKSMMRELYVEALNLEQA